MAGWGGRWTLWIAGILGGLPASGSEPRSVADAHDSSAANPADPHSAITLVEQLGHESFAQRQEAARRLRQLGVNAKGSLQSGLRDPDLEVRRGCRRLLAEVLDADFRRRLELLVADTEGTAPHELPCWRRFCEVYGKDKEARGLFVQMQRAEPALLESAEAGDELAVQAFRLRFQQVVQAMFGGDPREQKQLGVATLAALVLVAVDSNLRLPPDLLANQMWVNLFYQQPFQQSLNNGEQKAITRKLLGRWIQQSGGQGMLASKLQFAVQYQLKEGLTLALEMVRDAKSRDAHNVCCGIEGVARLGGKPYAALLVPLLADQRQFMRHTVTVNNKVEVRVVLVSDVALAWLIELTGQDHGQYGLPEAKGWFENLRRHPQLVYNFFNLGFKDAARREAAQKQWEAWAKGNRLPDAPKPSSEAVPRDPAGQPAAAALPALGDPQATPTATAKERPQEAAEPIPLALADRAQVQKLGDARKLIEQKNFSAAVGLLGGLLAAGTDSVFQPDRGSPVYRRLKAEAEELLGQLPDAGRNEYESQYGAAARRWLAVAVAKGEPELLAEVAGNYFYTEAGAEAAYLLGTHCRRTGELLRGASYLRRLEQQPQRAARFGPALAVELATCYWKLGMPQAARDVLGRKGRTLAGTLVLGGRSRPPASTVGEQDAAWLESLAGPPPLPTADWAIFGGSPAHTATVADSNPLLKPTYRVTAPADELIRQGIQETQKQHREGRTAAVPSLHPLVVGRTVLLRTATDLLALDVASGNLRWQAALEDSLQNFVQFADAERKKNGEEALTRGLARRLWADPAFGTMASDGRLVFGLECLSFDLGVSIQSMVILPDGRRQLDPGALKSYNTLSAYDIQTGKIRWEAGGPPGPGGGRLVGAFFLGPPLPLNGQLYAVADIQDQTRLLLLQPTTGAVLHQWVLSVHEEPSATTPGLPFPLNASETAIRRGASPAYADETLVCCTSDNRYVAVDLMSRTIRWVFAVPQESVGRTNRLLARQRGTAERPDRWCDGPATLAEGRVLVCPPDSEQLICLRLGDGHPEWTIPRGDGLYVGGVHQGRAIVVGRTSVRAVKLTDGSLAWNAEACLPANGVPCGRGYLGTTCYYLPLSTAEVVAIDVATGRLAARSRSPEQIVPGNLVCHQGAILSQTADTLCRFELLPNRDGQLDAALRAHPDDPQILAERGEVSLYQGRRAEAIGYLRRALQAKPDARTRQLLTDALCEGLHADFAAFFPLSAELEPLFDTPELRVRLVQELAAGLQRAGRSQEAFAQLEKWIAFLPNPHQLERVDAARCVRIDRRIQAAHADLGAMARPEARAEMERVIAAKLAGQEGLKFLPYYGFSPAADEVRLRLVEKLRAPGTSPEERRWIEPELLLQRVLRTGTAQQHCEATARWAALLRDAQRTEDAARLYGQLRGPLADTVCLDGRRGRELAEALPAGDPIRTALPPRDVWPSGNVTKNASQHDPRQPRSVRSRFPVWNAETDPRFQVSFEANGPALSELDPVGRVRWQLPLADAKVHPNYTHYLYQFSEGRMTGHLLVAMLGNRVCAVDTLNARGKILWAHDSPTTTPSASSGNVLPAMRRRFQNVRQAKPLAAASPAPLAVSTTCVCFEQDRKLLGVEPASGQVLWTRDDVASESDLQADDDMVFATPPDSTQAVVLSTVDGRELGRRPVPPLSKRITALGRRLLIWDTDPNLAQLKLLDPWTGQEVWRRDFSPQAQFWLVDASEIGVLEPQGKLVVLNTADGRQRFQASTEPLDALEGIVVWRRPTDYVLITCCPKPENSPFGEQILPGRVRVGGLVTSFDVNGHRRWATKIPNQLFSAYQPHGLPVLIFHRRFIKPVPTPAGMGSVALSELLLLDARNGSTLHEASVEGYDEHFDLQASPDTGRLEIHSQVHSIQLQFN